MTKALGECHVWIPESGSGQLVKSARTHHHQYANNCDRCCPALYGNDTSDGERAPPPLLSHSETPPHFVIAHWLYVPQQLCRCLRSSFLPSISFCLSLSSSSLVVSLDPSPFSPYTTTTTTSIVEFRQAIYIFLPGCFTSHSLNKVFFIVFAFLGARESERTHVCL